MAMVIDGSGATATGHGTSIAATITTPSANDIIIAFIHFDSNGLQTVSAVSGGGLTWTRRKQLTFTAGAPWYNTIEMWWAAAASALTSQTITATFTGTIDDSSLQLIAVNGVPSLAAPFDGNASLPATATNVSGSSGIPIATTISTSATAFVLGFYGTSSSNVGAIGSGFTSLYSTSNTGGALFSLTLSEHQSFATAQSGISVGFLGAGNGSGVIFDAFGTIAGPAGGRRRRVQNINRR
jgi:hypothetical protein